MNLKDRLQQLFSEKGYSYYRIALDCGIDPAQLKNSLAGRRPFSDGVLKKLAANETLGVSYPQLKAWKALELFGSGVIKLVYQNVQPQEYKVSTHVAIPYKGTVAAGAIQEPDSPDKPLYFDWFDQEKPTDDMFCLRVKGDSMEPRFPNGTLLLVRPARKLQDKGCYVFKTETGKTTLKLLEHSEKEDKLVPLNPEHKSIKAKDLDLSMLYEIVEARVRFI